MKNRSVKTATKIYLFEKQNYSIYYFLFSEKCIKIKWVFV